MSRVTIVFGSDDKVLKFSGMKCYFGIEGKPYMYHIAMTAPSGCQFWAMSI